MKRETNRSNIIFLRFTLIVYNILRRRGGRLILARLNFKSEQCVFACLYFLYANRLNEMGPRGRSVASQAIDTVSWGVRQRMLCKLTK